MAWSAVLSAPYNSDTQCVFATNGTLRKRLEGAYVYDWGIAAPVTPAVLGIGGSTGLTGTYNAKYTFARKERATVVCESNPSGAAATGQSPSNESLAIYAETPTDEQVNCIRFYRTTNGGTTYYWVADVNYVNQQYSCVHDWEEDDQYITGLAYRFTVEDANNTRECCTAWELVYSEYTLTDTQLKITSKADNIYYVDSVYTTTISIDNTTADASVGTAVATDHDRPPAGSFVFGPSHNGTLFMVKGHLLCFSKPGQPEYWPTTYYIEVAVPQYSLLWGGFFSRYPYVMDQRNVYYIAGATATEYKSYNQSAKTGTLVAAANVTVENHGIFHVGYDGIYLFIPGTDSYLGKDEKISKLVDPIFRGETLQGIPAVGDLTKSWLVWFDDKLYFGYPSAADTYPQHVIVFDSDNEKVSYYTYGNEWPVVCHDKYNERLLACISTGELWQLEYESATDDYGTPISWEVQTKEFLLQTRKHYPRWNKYDVDASAATSAIAVPILNETTIQEHLITGDRNTRRRLVVLSNGTRYSTRISGTGYVEIYAIESE